MIRSERLLTALLFALLASVALVLSAYKPFYNWDVIGYTAASKSYEETDAKALQSFTYDQLRHSVPEAKYAELTQGRYSSVIISDPIAFKQMLPFYQIRPMYTGLVYLLYKAGLNIVFATHIISAITVVIGLIFLYLLSVSYLEKPFIYALPPLALLFGVVDVARFSTPDGLAFLAVILCAYLYLKKHMTLLLILLPISLSIRMDLILFTMPLLFFMFVLKEAKRWKIILSVIMSVVIYISIENYWKGAGWFTFLSAVVYKPTYMMTEPPTLALQDYLYAVFLGAGNLVNDKPFILYALLVAFWLYLIRNYEKATTIVETFKSSSTVLVIVCLFFVISHFFAFPVIEDRYFAATSLITALLLMIKLQGYWKLAHPSEKGTAAQEDISTLRPL